MNSFKLWVLRIWHRLRYVDFRNPIRVVSPTNGGDDAGNVQKAIDDLANNSSDEYQIYLIALQDYNHKWYRLFIRKPFWVEGGVVQMTSGSYDIKNSVVLSAGVIFGQSTWVAEFEKPKKEPK